MIAWADQTGWGGSQSAQPQLRPETKRWLVILDAPRRPLATTERLHETTATPGAKIVHVQQKKQSEVCL